ncbi:MAG: RluA family pseudouridine synthase [Xanthomonadales bacterium]|nr:RluA family pseudouridine synthase [Xanthomonadales bacterium]
MSKVRHVKVSREREGQRLDNFLLGELKGAPRSLVYRLIRKGQVRVNGGRCKPMQKLATGDDVRIPPVKTAEKTEVKFSPDQQSEILGRILHEDERYLAVDKPAGMAVHAGSGLPWGLIDVLRAARPDGFLELVHRLDRETSGCLIIARSRETLLEAQEALKARAVDKRYLCLLEGDLAEEPVTVDVPLKRGVERGGERLVEVHPEGKRAVTHFKPIERLPGWTLVEAEIETGRTHQIRVHARHIGHPIAGDDKYGDHKPPAGLRRLFLHCSMFGLELPASDYALTASSELPDELRDCLDRLIRR